MSNYESLRNGVFKRRESYRLPTLKYGDEVAFAISKYEEFPVIKNKKKYSCKKIYRRNLL